MLANLILLRRKLSVRISRDARDSAPLCRASEPNSVTCINCPLPFLWQIVFPIQQGKRFIPSSLPNNYLYSSASLERGTSTSVGNAFILLSRRTKKNISINGNQLKASSRVPRIFITFRTWSRRAALPFWVMMLYFWYQSIVLCNLGPEMLFPSVITYHFGICSRSWFLYEEWIVTVCIFSYDGAIIHSF